MFYKILLILVIVFAIWLCILRYKRRKKIRSCEQFPNGIWQMPLVGHGYLLLGGAEAKMKAFQRLGREALKQGGVTSTHFWLFDIYLYVIGDPVVAELVLKNCFEKHVSIKLLSTFIGDGIFTAPAHIWKPRRKLLNPTFSLRNLNNFVEVFNKNGKILVESLENEVGMGPFSMFDYAASYTLDSVCESILGTELDSQKRKRHPVMDALSMSCELLSHRMCFPWLYNQTVYEMTSQYKLMKQYTSKLFDFIETFVKAKLQEYTNKSKTKGATDHEDQNTGPKTILQLMIENSGGDVLPTEQYLKEESLIFTFAATDTTSLAFSYVMLMLAAYPDVQEKAFKEMEEVFEDLEQDIRAEDLPQLKYTEAVIKETLRLYPPAPIFIRTIDKDIPLPNGKKFLAGTGAIVHTWATQRNPQYWGEDAEEFRPERFFRPISHPAAFLVFGHGPRNCIGSQYAIMSLKTSVTSVLRRFRVISANNQEDVRSLRTKFDILMRDVNNFKIQLERR